MLNDIMLQLVWVASYIGLGRESSIKQYTDARVTKLGWLHDLATELNRPAPMREMR